ncbi:hypothetical protein MAJJADAN_00058 [Pseudomonas phage Amjad_SA]|nr:hypothetical protein MAJJADAN_00058 [Pseudomonas phage Amjad_SA]
MNPIRIYDSGHRGECRKEYCEQIDSISWLEANYPERWPLIFHCPNEIKASAQHMQRRRKMGVRPGVADIIDFGRHRGAFELKVADSKQASVSRHQMDFLLATAESGGFAAICYGFDQFKLAYADYLAWVAEQEAKAGLG